MRASGRRQRLRHKDIRGMELAQAIKDVGAGKSLLDIRAAAALMARLRGAAEHNDPLSGLTDRERTLLGLLSEGLTNRRIAARIPLRTATTAIHAIGGLVKVEAAVIRGSPEIALIAESRYAAMVCVGSMGIGRLPHVLLGSTATGPAHKAHCPVAIIRTDHDAPASDAGWVAVVVDDSPSNDAVLEHGFLERPPPVYARYPDGALAECVRAPYWHADCGPHYSVAHPGPFSCARPDQSVFGVGDQLDEAS